MGWVRSANRLANKPYRQNAGFLQNVNLLKAEKRQFLDFQVENRTKLALSVAPSTRFERVAFRLGVWRAAWYIVRFIICLVVLSEIVLPGYWSICIKIPVMPPRDGAFRKSN